MWGCGRICGEMCRIPCGIIRFYYRILQIPYIFPYPNPIPGNSATGPRAIYMGGVSVYVWDLSHFVATFHDSTWNPTHFTTNPSTSPHPNPIHVACSLTTGMPAVHSARAAAVPARSLPLPVSRTATAMLPGCNSGRSAIINSAELRRGVHSPTW